MHDLLVGRCLLGPLRPSPPWALEVAVVGELALDPKPALAILPVGHAHLLATDLCGLGVRGERDVFLQGAESLVCLNFEWVGEHAAT